jgi:hypothetical protein
VWRKVLDGPARFARNAGFVAVAIGMALIARHGTTLSRVAALAGCAAAILLGLLSWVVLRRRSRSPRQLVRQVILPTDAPLGARAMRAAGLLERLSTEPPSTSLELARVHLERLVARASLDRVQKAAARRAARYRALGLILTAAVITVGVLAAREIAEGFNVLGARGQKAPVPMSWTDRLRIIAQPPAYLRAPPRRLLSGSTANLPKGTGLTLRARALYPDRLLVVSDGAKESAFVSDGEGGLVAHYTVEDDVSLVVAARFGDVLVLEPEGVQISALPDEAPAVTLEDAPATLKLSELTRLELRWAAEDDHGLKQVDLVLRSGNREERRVLATYDDEAPEQRGGHVLLPTDPFLRSLYLPAQVSIEARDNDPVEGSKWGKSAAFVLVPTAVGEPDSQRYLALVLGRDRFVDALGVAESGERADQAGLFEHRLEQAVHGLSSALAATYGGLRVPPGLRSFALGRLRVLTDQGNTGVAQRAAALGDLILALDGALGSLSTRDAQRVSKVLAEVAEEAMSAAQLAQAPEGGAAALDRLDRALYALRAGAEQLTSLGGLGNDLGSVALADLGRVQRARDGLDLYHAELAARHLADRLRRPTPSFGSANAGGVEAGQSGSSEPSGPSSNAEQAYDQLARQIAELAHEHAAAVEQVDQTLSGAEAGTDPETLRAEAERRAGELRDAVEVLPELGTSPGTSEASAALGREQARSMAHNLESVRLQEAVDAGRRALRALDDALNKAQAELSSSGDLEIAKSAVEEQLHWAEDQLAQSQQAARESSRQALQGPAALEEELAGTAAGLARRGEKESTPLPAEVTERLRQADQLMRQAARALKSGEGEAGLGLQRQAQRLLENADQGKASESEPTEESTEDDAAGKAAGFGGDVPNADEQNKAEAFRRRVLQNLGDNQSGRRSPAIKRYAEGLLR